MDEVLSCQGKQRGWKEDFVDQRDQRWPTDKFIFFPFLNASIKFPGSPWCGSLSFVFNETSYASSIKTLTDPPNDWLTSVNFRATLTVLEHTFRHDICQIFYTSAISKFTPQKCWRNRNILNPNVTVFAFLVIELEWYPNFHMYNCTCSLNTLSSFKTRYDIIKKLNHITLIALKTYPQSEILPKW